MSTAVTGSNRRRTARTVGWGAVATSLFVLAVPGAQSASASDAADRSQAQCKKEGGIWFKLDGFEPSPCWQAPGAFLVNIGKGKEGDGIDYIKGGQSERFKYPNYVVVTKNTYKVCDDKAAGTDFCSVEPMDPGVYDLCDLIPSRQKYDTRSTNLKYCSMNDVYIERR